ncbi:VOC family protein [Streptomyces spirodelae]|uniref:VOC family protein n=1 Tax=Streptomyces spirodelae TaxID=2812904 RepID=A0ABS3X1U4_9ACTN|nr:VOC family protein [Streptomyces spirodelae]MBO8189356.1 VOC family protein [Streptomyces spirodelae]
MTEATGPRVGGIVLGSTDPERLWEWYRTAFAPRAAAAAGPEDGEGPAHVLELSGTYVIFESRDDVGRKSVEPGRILINFEVTDIHGMARRLTERLNPHWVRPVEAVDEDVLLGTVEDPDGNYVQLFEVTGKSADQTAADSSAA